MTEKKFNSKMPSASAAAVNNSNSNNNAAAAKAEREERLRSALKAYVLKERQRKKEEVDAKEEEERLRKEREERDHQNDVSLENTREKIAKLDQQIKDLHNQKQQLFLQLKKVLNEDENRKKQQKDEMYAMQALQAQQVNVAPPPPQVFIPPVRMQHHQIPIIPKPVANQPVKRTRSPSPPTHQTYYKNTNYTQPKHDDGRRGTEYSRVTWNKPPAQYQASGALFYPTAGNAPQPQPDGRGPAIIYPYGLPLRHGFHLDLQPTPSVPVSKSDQAPTKPTQVYHISLDAPPISQSGPPVSAVQQSVQSQKPQVTMEKISDRYHPDVKHEVPTGHGPPHQLPDGVVYTPMMPGMSLHPNIMQISSNPGQVSVFVTYI
ncbi:unnamed protein product [Ceratitis capitata]|uniref:(Mediterranean fruit fly) hypothetical protein n=1 Tax=Ceratitis capitata TaxID=7213 RepID=A0A811VMY9_CERCA|nr:unnamed protein product [Ceratitis capitata]